MQTNEKIDRKVPVPDMTDLKKKKEEFIHKYIQLYGQNDCLCIRLNVACLFVSVFMGIEHWEYLIVGISYIIDSYIISALNVALEWLMMNGWTDLQINIFKA